MGNDDRHVHSQERQEATERRHVYGPRQLGQVLPAITRVAFRRKSAAAAQLMADWPLVIGPALAAVTAPLRMSGTTLTLACAGPVALELAHMEAEVAGRINGYLGRIAVERLRFVQRPVSTAAPRPARPQMAATVPQPLPGVAPGALYEALQRLGEAVRRG